MEPLFLAVICGCNAGLFREALHEVYIPRIQRGNTYFAANVLGARGPLLTVLSYFFEQGHWGSLGQTCIEAQCLSAEDQLFILMQAGLYLTETRGFAAPGIQVCYERAESLCHSLNRPLHLYLALMGHYRFSLVTDRLSAAMQTAERVYFLAQEQNDAALMIGAYTCYKYFHLLLRGGSILVEDHSQGELWPAHQAIRNQQRSQSVPGCFDVAIPFRSEIDVLRAELSVLL
jgi:hypothetical protein